MTQFSMEKILDWRLDLEDEARMQLSRLEEKWQQENRQLQSLIQENTKVKNDYLKNVQIYTLRYNDYYKLVLDEKIVQQKNQIDRTQAEIKIAHDELIETHKNRKAMEKLKEKELDLLYQKEKRQEQHQLDEMATMTYRRTAL